MTEVHLAEAQLKRKMIESCEQLVALVDATKFGKEDMTSFARVERINHLLTDLSLAPEWVERLKQAGVDVTICEDELNPAK